MKRTGKPVLTEGRVTVTSFVNGWCPAQNIVHERPGGPLRVGDSVVFDVINTLDRSNLEKWGIADALFIDSKRCGLGLPFVRGQEDDRKKVRS